MTWEDVYKKLCERAINDTSPLGWEVALALKEELGDCIIIKKGENRHPYADVFHEWAEDTTKVVEAMDSSNNWCKSLINKEVLNSKHYRIKPSEPIYEWQWYYYSKSEDKAFLTQRHYTEDEVKECLNEGHKKIEETKRERKNA